MPRNSTIKLKGGTAANIAAANPTPAAREVVVEQDTRLMKIGDGVSSYTSLGYVRPYVTATDRLLGRSTAGGGVAEEITCTSFARTLLDDTDAATGRTTLAAAPTASPTFTGAVTVPNGSAASPAVISPTGTSDTGLYFPGADTVGISTAGVERLRVSSTGALTSVIPGGSTLLPNFACRAWVNFNGTGAIAIRGSGNVTSIGDGGAGLYTINFTTAMPDANYAVCVSCYATGTDRFSCAMDTYAAGSVRIRGQSNATSALIDMENCNVAIFR